MFLLTYPPHFPNYFPYNLQVNITTGIISTAVGNLSNPNGLAFDSTGNLFIADSGNNLVRKVSEH